jgi:hypothetical protein
MTSLPKITHIDLFIVGVILMSSMHGWGMALFRGPFRKIAKHLPGKANHRKYVLLC